MKWGEQWNLPIGCVVLLTGLGMKTDEDVAAYWRTRSEELARKLKIQRWSGVDELRMEHALTAVAKKYDRPKDTNSPSHSTTSSRMSARSETKHLSLPPHSPALATGRPKSGQMTYGPRESGRLSIPAPPKCNIVPSPQPQPPQQVEQTPRATSTTPTMRRAFGWSTSVSSMDPQPEQQSEYDRVNEILSGLRSAASAVLPEFVKPVPVAAPRASEPPLAPKPVPSREIDSHPDQSYVVVQSPAYRPAPRSIVAGPLTALRSSQQLHQEVAEKGAHGVVALEP